MYGTYLTHHGIEGQKWGKRNGPPYPLGEEDHSAAEKRYMSGNKKRDIKHIQKDFAKKSGNDLELAKTQESYRKKIDQENLKAYNDVKKADPNIGAVFELSNGRMAASSQIKNELNKGNHIISIKWMCYGDTLEKTLDMIETTNKFGNEERINSLIKEYEDKSVEALAKDLGLEPTEKAKKYLLSLGF